MIESFTGDLELKMIQPDVLPVTANNLLDNLHQSGNSREIAENLEQSIAQIGAYTIPVICNGNPGLPLLNSRGRQ